MSFFWTYTSNQDEEENTESCKSQCGNKCKKQSTQECCGKKECDCNASCGVDVENNDGRKTCYLCDFPTRSAGSGLYNVCTNKKCKWYNR